jgi:hypothetical protein
MHTSSRVSRAVRNGLVLGTAAAAALGLAGCKAVPSFNLDSSASGITAQAPGSGGPTGISTQPGSETGAPGAPAGAATPGSTGHKAPGAGSPSTGSGPASGQPTGGGQAPLPASGAPQAGGPVLIGSVAGGYKQALAGTGVQLADHTYSFFSGSVPQAQMLTVSAGGTPWRQVAAAAPGSTLYNQIVTWAQTIKARGGKIMVAYNHEPEGHDRLTLGTPADFINAYRHVETIFDQQGATNVMWTWQMTANAFAVNPSSDQYAAKWYPGDQWVDNVGADAYNWMGCGSSGGNNYRELQQIGDPVLAFARAHGKLASFPEFASEANGNRTQWLANAHQYFVQNGNILTAAFYFNRPPTVAANAACKWPLTTSAEYGALRAMAQDTAHFAV